MKPFLCVVVNVVIDHIKASPNLGTTNEQNNFWAAPKDPIFHPQFPLFIIFFLLPFRSENVSSAFSLPKHQEKKTQKDALRIPKNDPKNDVNRVIRIFNLKAFILKKSFKKIRWCKNVYFCGGEKLPIFLYRKRLKSLNKTFGATSNLGNVTKANAFDPAGF